MPSKPKSKNIKKITPKAHHNEFPNTSEKNILKSPREWTNTVWAKKKEMTANFLLETMKARRQWSKVFKILKTKFQCETLQAVNVSSKDRQNKDFTMYKGWKNSSLADLRYMK